MNSKLKTIQTHALAAKSTSCLGALTGGIQEALGQVKQLYCSTHRFGFAWSVQEEQKSAEVQQRATECLGG